jgi:hypothetical protein
LGSAEHLWDSIQRILSLPGHTRLFACHDYQPGGREIEFESTVEAEQANNIHVKAGTKKEEFIKWRTERDHTLSIPKLIIPSIQININAGKFPDANKEGNVVLVDVLLVVMLTFSCRNCQSMCLERRTNCIYDYRGTIKTIYLSTRNKDIV